MPSSKRYTWLDIAKILACFLVIVNHSHSLSKFAGVTTTVAIFDAVTFAICKIAVPIFVMTTGVLLLQKETTWKKTVIRILRVGVPLLVISIIHYVIAKDSNRTVWNFLRLLVSMPLSTHLWYLYMLIGLYLAIPFIHKITKTASDKELLIFVLFFLIIPSVASFVAKVFHVSISSHLLDAFFPAALAYLIAGYVLSRVALKRKYVFLSVLLFIISISIFVLSILCPYFKTGKLTDLLEDWKSLPVALASLSAFYILRYAFEKKQFRDKTEKVIRTVSGTTFGVYLIHIIALRKIPYIGIMRSIFAFDPCIGTVVTQIGCFVLCVAVIFVLKKIPGIKRFL